MKRPTVGFALGTVVALSWLSGVAVLTMALRFGVEAGFQSYLDSTQAAAHGRLMGALEASERPGGGWDEARLADLGQQALREGLVLSVKDAHGTTVWDTRRSAPDAVQEVFDTLEARLRAREPWSVGRWEPTTHPLGGSGAEMTLDVFQPRRLGPADLAFLNRLDGWLLLSALVGLVVSLGVGTAAAYGIARPLGRLGRTLRRFAEADYSEPPAPRAFLSDLATLEADARVLAQRLEAYRTRRRQAEADAAHELRTPLANLHAQLEALADGVLAPSPERWTLLRGEVERLRGLVQAWEDWEAAGAAGLEPGHCPDPAETVARIVDLFGPRATDQGLTLSLVTNPTGPWPLASTSLERIVTNLVENALRHGPRATKVVVTVGPGPRLTVDDQGPGIPPELREAVFERFFRVDPARGKGGLGLGLALVRTLAQSSGGQAKVGDSPTGGCRAEVWWPEAIRGTLGP